MAFVPSYHIIRYKHVSTVIMGVAPAYIPISDATVICQPDGTYWLNVSHRGVLTTQSLYGSWTSVKKWLTDNDLVKE